MPFRDIPSRFLTNQCVIVFCAPTEHHVKVWKGFVRTLGYPIVARKAVYPGYAKRAMALEDRYCRVY